MSYKTVNKPLEWFIANDENYRGHTEHQVSLLQESLRTFGVFKNVVARPDGTVLCGHGIITAALAEGLKTLPVQIFEGSDAEARALMVADNELSRPGLVEDDPDALSQLLASVEADGLLQVTGHDEASIAALLEQVAAQAPPTGVPPPEDEGPGEPPEEPVTKLGDVWCMGEHRLVCGDCTDAGAWEAALNGRKWQALVSSPPYGGGDNAGYKADYSGETKRFYVHNEDALSPAEWLSLNNAMLLLAGEHNADPLSVVVLNIMYNANNRRGYGELVFAGAHKFKVQETICWDKQQGFPSASGGILSRNWELVFVLSEEEKYWTSQGPNEVRWCKWDIPRPRAQENEHKATYPVELPIRAINEFAPAGAIVADPFLGSGTTLIACEQLGRKCVGIELSPAYCDVICRRYTKYSGKPAILESTGETFDALQQQK